MMTNSNWERYLKREHPDFHRALLKQLVACRQQHIFVSEKGRYETPKEKYVVSVKDGTWLIFHPRRKNGKRVHIKNMKKDYRKCIRSYASFLRADGIDNADEMLYYILHYTYYHISFNRVLTITYDKTRPIIDEVMKWIMKKDIEKVDKSKFIDPRKIAAPNEICNGAIRKARKSEKISFTRQTQKLLTDKRIAEMYNPDLTIEENCANIGIKPTRLKQWKRENADSIESIEDKVKRLYNPELSWTKNAEIIGYSVNTIKKYVKKQEEPIAVDFGIPGLETADIENQFTECLDIDNDEILTDNTKIVTHSPDTIKTYIEKDFGSAELETVDNENLFDADDNELIRWALDIKFMEEVERENENTDSDESIEHQVKKEDPIAIDVRTPELETAECENQFAGRIDLENDDFCRWMFGEEFMAEIERERKRNALLYETEEVVKMVV
jgi:hypothetical protein